MKHEMFRKIFEYVPAVQLLRKRFSMCRTWSNHNVVQDRNTFHNGAFLAFSAELKAKCINWYHRNCSITQTERNFRTKKTKSLPSRSSILTCGQTFERHCGFENAQASGRPVASSEQKQTVLYFFI